MKFLPCTCQSDYQDKKYKGLRAHTIGIKDYVCTVCGAKKAGAGGEKKPETKKDKKK